MCNFADNLNRYMDGVPGITQCPIVPEGTFQYEFLADLYGTSWYHSHFSSQYADGIFGPMIIHGPPTVSYDIGMMTRWHTYLFITNALTDIGPIMLNDYYHVPYYTLVEETLAIPGVVSYLHATLIMSLINFSLFTPTTMLSMGGTLSTAPTSLQAIPASALRTLTTPSLSSQLARNIVFG
jgi:FtsP/CotA-like multicopper oxidase with cupredoxin domain